MGLAIARDWMTSLSGSINYFPSDHGGAGFLLTLKAEPATQQMLEPQDLVARQPFKDKHILLLEDDELIRTLSSEYLEKLGAEITVAGDGAEGLALFEQVGKQFDLIITDYFMPKLDGAEFIKLVRQQDTNIPIVAVTAATLGQEKTILENAGADLVIGKPMDERILVAFLERRGAIERERPEGARAPSAEQSA